MSTANGSGEPSMEEILASIRNIIAHEPGTEGDAAAEAAGPVNQDQPSPTAPQPEIASQTSEAVMSAAPAQEPATSLKSVRPGIPEAPAAANKTATQSNPASAAAAPKPQGGLSQRLAVQGGGQPSSEPGSSAPQSDDFADLFEEPLSAPAPISVVAPTPFQAVPEKDTKAPEPAGPKDASAVPPSRDTGEAGTDEAEAPIGFSRLTPSISVSPEKAAGAPPLGASSAPSTPGVAVGEKKTVGQSEQADASGAAKPASGAFDFAALRPSREAPGGLSEKSPAKFEPSIDARPAEASPAGSESLSAGSPLGTDVAGSEVEEPVDRAGIGAAPDRPEEPKKRVVIASMQPPAIAPAPAPPKAAPEVVAGRETAATGSTAGVDAKPENGPADAIAAQPAQQGANVGFLAQSLRPIDPAGEDAGPAMSQPPEKAAGDQFEDSALANDAVSEDDVPTEVLLKSQPEPRAKRDGEAVEKPAEPVQSKSPELAKPSDALPRSASDAAQDAVPGEAAASEEKKVAAVSGPVAAPVGAVAAPGGPDTKGVSAADVVISSMGGQVRTLEDTVAELLRPLLREWLENNMPRIVENALRLEVAESVKKQLEVTVNKPNGLERK